MGGRHRELRAPGCRGLLVHARGRVLDPRLGRRGQRPSGDRTELGLGRLHPREWRAAHSHPDERHRIDDSADRVASPSRRGGFNGLERRPRARPQAEGPQRTGLESRLRESTPVRLGARPVRVGMALYGDLTYDSRVRREAVTLTRAGYDVSIVCLAGDAPSSDIPEGVRVLVRRPTSTRVLPGAPSPFFGMASGRVGAATHKLRWLVDYVRNLRA